MSHQPDNRIQQIPTQEQLLTETHASEQNIQNLTEEQLKDVNGGLPWMGVLTVASMAPTAIKAGKSVIKRVF